MQTAAVILVVGLLIFLSHLFSALFDKVRIPDVLPLIILGLFIGPIFHLVSPSDFGEIGSVFTTLALVIILFEGGLDLNVNQLKEAFIPAIKLALTTFAITFSFLFIIACEFLKLPYLQAALLGLAISATSPPIVIPMLAKLNLKENIKTTLILESTFCEVFSIILTLAVLNASLHHSEGVTTVFGSIIASFTLAMCIGVLAAIVWSNVLKIIRKVENNIFCTPAFVCIVYGISELFGYSGPVATLAFGISLGNIRKIITYLPQNLMPSEHSTLTDREISFFAAIVFLVKTFFFIYLGLTIHFDNPHIILVATIITAWVYLSRLIVVKLMMPASLGATPTDNTMMSIMIPKGLATAVLANLILQSNIAMAQYIKEIAYGVILFSISITAIMAFCLEKGLLDGFSNYFFTKFQKSIITEDEN